MLVAVFHRQEEDELQVPIYLKGETLPLSKTDSTQRPSRIVQRASTLKDQTTLSLQRPQRKPKSFRKRTKRRPKVHSSFFDDMFARQQSAVSFEWY